MFETRLARFVALICTVIVLVLLFLLTAPEDFRLAYLVPLSLCYAISVVTVVGLIWVLRARR